MVVKSSPDESRARIDDESVDGLRCAGGPAGACSLAGAGGLVVLSLAGTVCGLEFLGDGIDHLFLTLRSLQVFFVAAWGMLL